MKAMTYSEFDQIATSSFNEMEAANPGEIRAGQAYFNLLMQVRPDIATKMRGSLVDPFYKHRVTEVVRQFVAEHWDK